MNKQFPSKQGFAVIALGGDVAIVPLAAQQSSNGTKYSAASMASARAGSLRSGAKVKQNSGLQLVAKRSAE